MSKPQSDAVELARELARTTRWTFGAWIAVLWRCDAETLAWLRTAPYECKAPVIVDYVRVQRELAPPAGTERRPPG